MVLNPIPLKRVGSPDVCAYAGELSELRVWGLGLGILDVGAAPLDWGLEA